VGCGVGRGEKGLGKGRHVRRIAAYPDIEKVQYTAFIAINVFNYESCLGVQSWQG
jgi:hypothetical protein